VTVCIVDTSIFCVVLGVKGSRDDHREVIEQFQEKARSGETLLLPMATVLETGNHIGRHRQGRTRRGWATKFKQIVLNAIEGNSPFYPTPIQQAETIKRLLAGFPDAAARGLTFCDLTIVDTWREQCDKCPLRRVYIWSLDIHLRGFDRVQPRRS